MRDAPDEVQLLRVAIHQARRPWHSRQYGKCADALEKLLPEARALGAIDLEAQARYWLTDACWRDKQFERQLTHAQAGLGLCGKGRDPGGYVARFRLLDALALHGLKRTEEARLAVMTFLDSHHADPRAGYPFFQLIRMWPEIGPQLMPLDEAIDVLRANIGGLFIGSDPDYRGIGYLYQHALVEMLLAAGEHSAALGEAKLIFYLTSIWDPGKGRWMLGKAAQASGFDLRHRRHLFAHLQYGCAGRDGKRGTHDDPPNVLTECRVVSTPARDLALQDVFQAQPNTYLGHRKRAYVHLLRDRLTDAANELRAAYKLCPDDDRAQQQAKEGLALVLVAHHGAFLAAQAFRDTCKRLPAGRDPVLRAFDAAWQRLR